VNCTREALFRILALFRTFTGARNSISYSFFHPKQVSDGLSISISAIFSNFSTENLIYLGSFS
jgi:hypothetical protein